MTAIVALAHGGKVYMGCDSATVNGGSFDLSLRHTADPKIVTFEEYDLIIGSAGSGRLTSLIRDKFTPPDDADYHDQPKRVYASVVRDALKDLFEAEGILSNDKPAYIEGSCLIGYQGVVWQMDGEFSLMQLAEPFAALGCGDQVALGAMAILVKTSNPADNEGFAVEPQWMVLEALRAAEKFSAGVRGPFVVKVV